MPFEFSPGARFVLLYDGQCPVCRASVDFLRKRRGSERLQSVPLQTPGVLEHFGIDGEAALRELHVVDRQGRVIAGADGVLAAMAALPRWRWLGAVRRIPGMLPVARGVYRFFADRRVRQTCPDGSCHLR